MPPAKVVRRRRAGVLGVAAAAFVLGASVGAGDEEPRPLAAAPPAPSPAALRLAAPTASPEPSAVERLSLREQVGKLVVLRFQGTTAPDYVRDVLEKRWAAGAILFRDNITGPDQLRALTRQLRRSGGRPVPIVCTDQEGGAIRNVAWAPPASAQAGQVPGRDGRPPPRHCAGTGST